LNRKKSRIMIAAAGGMTTAMIPRKDWKPCEVLIPRRARIVPMAADTTVMIHLGTLGSMALIERAPE
jgi:hypothetical protein